MTEPLGTELQVRMQLGVTHGCSPCAKNSVRGSTQNPAQGSLSPRIIPRSTTLGCPVYISYIYEPLVPFFLSFTNHTPTKTSRPPSEGGVVLLSADRTSGLHHLRRPIFAPSPTTTIYSNPTAVLHCALGGGASQPSLTTGLRRCGPSPNHIRVCKVGG